MSIALVGVGIEKLSMAPSALLSVKEALRAVSYMEAQQQGRTACRET
jgi:phosphoenolpyruvate-protein kinase (PTS system EI component)